MTCAKQRIHTKAEAKRVAKVAAQTLRSREMHAYRCRSCDYFHVGHNGTYRSRSEPRPCWKCGRPVELGGEVTMGLYPVEIGTTRPHRCRRAAA